MQVTPRLLIHYCCVQEYNNTANMLRYGVWVGKSLALFTLNVLLLLLAQAAAASLMPVQALTPITKINADGNPAEPFLADNIIPGCGSARQLPVVFVELNIRGGYKGYLQSDIAATLTALTPLMEHSGLAAHEISATVAHARKNTSISHTEEIGTMKMLPNSGSISPSALSSYNVATVPEPITLALGVFLAMLLSLAGLTRFWGYTNKPCETK